MWKRIHIIAGTLNARGGRELLTLAFIRSIVECDLAKEVYLYTRDEPNPAIVHTFPLNFVQVLKCVKFKPLGIMYAQTLWRGMPYFKIARMLLTINSREELVVNLNADSVPIPAHICYVHFPYFGVRQSIISTTLRSRFRKIAHVEVLRLCKLVLVNSNFTKGVLCYVASDVCNKVLVLYPPLPIEPLNEDEFDKSLNMKENSVLTVSRFSKEKRLENILDIARRVEQGKFVIVGTLHDKDYYEHLKKLILKNGIHNVELYPNIPFDELHTLRKKSKIYLHPMPYEHFGISIIEAMASGCVPVVHKSGGPWQDILECSEEYGYAFESINEAITKIRQLLTDFNLYYRKATIALKKSRKFSYKYFTRSLYRLLERIKGL